MSEPATVLRTVSRFTSQRSASAIATDKVREHDSLRSQEALVIFSKPIRLVVWLDSH